MRSILFANQVFILAHKLIQVIVLEVGRLNEELTDESNQGKLYVCESQRLIEHLNYLEHINEVEPVPWKLRATIFWGKWLLENKFADEVDRVVLRMQHGNMKYLDDFVDEHCQKALVSKEQGLRTILAVLSMFLKSILYQVECRLH